MKLRTVHVGVGGRGRWAVEVMQHSSDYDPVALVDVDQRALRAAEAEMGWSHDASFGRLDQALRAVDADAVVIATPTHTHADYAGQAFAHGKHVLVEKAMTNHWQTAVELVTAARQAEVCFCVAQNYRYLTTMTAIKRLLNDPADSLHPGPIGIADASFHRFRPEPLNFTYPFAMVWDMGCHHADLLVDWFGPVRRVTAQVYNAPWSRYEHPANVSAFLEFASGARCHYSLTHDATVGEWRILLHGDRGGLRTGGVPDAYWPGMDPSAVEFFPRPEQQLQGSASQQVVLPDLPSAEEAVAQEFVRYVRGGPEPGTSGRNNLESLAVCELLVRSAEQRRAVERVELEPNPSDLGG